MVYPLKRASQEAACTGHEAKDVTRSLVQFSTCLLKHPDIINPLSPQFDTEVALPLWYF